MFVVKPLLVIVTVNSIGDAGLIESIKVFSQNLGYVSAQPGAFWEAGA